MLTLLLYMLSTLKGMCRRIAILTISQSVPPKADRIPLILIMIVPLYYPPPQGLRVTGAASLSLDRYPHS